MKLDAVQLAKELIAIDSVSERSNLQIADFLKNLLHRCGFEVEWLEYLDANREHKVSLVAKKGRGTGGFGLFSHSDTVPGDAGEWEPFTPTLRAGRLIGRGACDMKGPLAATIAAATDIDGDTLQKPLYLIITADEEVGYGGAKQVIAESQLLNAGWPEHGVIAEPTRLRPVYAHKGGARIFIAARGRAAHTSTDQGISANFIIAPFLAEMAELAKLFKQDARFMNDEFNPPTNGFNMVINDGGCKSNVTAARSVCTLSLRPMPNDHHEEAIAMILERAKKYDLDVSSYSFAPFYADRDAAVVQAALATTGRSQAETVPFGTEAAVFKEFTQLVILGPGDVAQAHTIGEWIDVAELQQAVPVYKRMIEQFCL
jgi:acetylornithine deacetylase